MSGNYTYDNSARFPIKAWNKGVHFDSNTLEQIYNVANLPFIHHHVAVMPDAHVGIGATIGTVIATKGAIVPAAVGVDIGCGMCAWQLSIKASDLPDSLGHVRATLERAIPHGRTNGGKTGDRGAWGDIPKSVALRWSALADGYAKIIEKHPQAKSFNGVNHLGTMGTGNHFFELCLDEADNVWLMLHSGSRGIGNKIGMYFIEQAKEEMARYHITDFLPNADCAYLVEHTEIFDDYIKAVSWAQDFASESRLEMMDNAIKSLKQVLPPFQVTETAINCHHNYVAREHHFGENVLVTRKGAVRAREGDLGIIPGSMATGSYIVRGLGNTESFCSCSHGAGRRMSRGQAFKEITLEQHIHDTAGVECRKDKEVLDESPAAYKNLEAVIAAQSDLVEIVYRLKTIVNVKG